MLYVYIYIYMYIHSTYSRPHFPFIASTKMEVYIGWSRFDVLSVGGFGFYGPLHWTPNMASAAACLVLGAKHGEYRALPHWAPSWRVQAKVRFVI
jgi:hypothetical protein